LVHKAKIEVETRTHFQQFSIEEVHVHVCSVIETRQSKATMPKDNSSYSQEKKLAARGVLRTRQTPYQLSHRGNSAGPDESFKCD